MLERASSEPKHPIRFDFKMNEYYIAHGDGGHDKMLVYYCPFCGGRAGESRRGSKYALVTEQEEERIYALLERIRTVEDALARYGPPDEQMDSDSTPRDLESGCHAFSGGCVQRMIYRNLSPVADILFEVMLDGSVQGSWEPKYTGESDA